MSFVGPTIANSGCCSTRARKNRGALSSDGLQEAWSEEISG